MTVPQIARSLGYLRAADAPLITQRAVELYGIEERIDGKPNPILFDWVRELADAGIVVDYTDVNTPWCGLWMAIVALRAEKPVVQAPLWALNWRAFGTPVDAPALGDVMIKTRKGGGHVGTYAGETRSHYLMIGGNTDDAARGSLFAKSSADFTWSFRRPVYRRQPATVQRWVLEPERLGNMAKRDARQA